MEYHSNAHSNITKYLTRTSRSKTGTEAITSATSRPDWILVEHVCEILQSVQVEDLRPRLVDTILKSISSVLLYGLTTETSSCDDFLGMPLRSSPRMLQCVCVYYQVRLMLWKRNLQRARIFVVPKSFGNIVRCDRVCSAKRLPTKFRRLRLGNSHMPSSSSVKSQ